MRQRLERLRRIERVREIARQTAARDAAEAESTRAQLAALADRTQQLAADYARADAARDGAALARATRLGGSLQSLRRTTAADAVRAGELADRQLAVLAEAERRRAVVTDRIGEARARIAADAERPALTARKRWHDA